MVIEFSPDPPGMPRYDPGHRTWVLSRFADVSAALKEAALVLAAASGETVAQGGDPEERSQNATDVAADVQGICDGERGQFEKAARGVVAAAAARGQADLVLNVAHEWSVLVMTRLGAEPSAEPAKIANAARRILYQDTGRSGWTGLKRWARPVANRWANRQSEKAKLMVDDLIGRGVLRLTQSTFISMAQTLPSFLGKAWLALLKNPEQAALLGTQPNRMESALHELLRFAGIVHTLYRKAIRDVSVNGTPIAAGDFVVLKVQRANFDEEKFIAPYRMDLARKPAGHLGLGAGIHACAGAAMVRGAFATLTPLLLEAGPELDRRRPVVWNCGQTLCWPVKVPVLFRGKPGGRI